MRTPDESAPTDRSMSHDEMHRDFVEGLLGATVGGRYVVTRLLGQGAMGAVFAARHTELEQNVAIKFMFPEFASNRVYSARFAREAKVAANVQSPHLVRVFDVGRIESGVPYLVMERLTGRDLATELEERKALPITEAVDLVLQAMAGVGELHGLGYVHRDLKPSNMFLADVAGVRTLKILDFGISKEAPSTASGLTSTESLLGTPSYMSPEQIKNSKEVDARSDLWSLGVILYELVTGRLPFETSSNGIGELFGVILFRDPTPPRAYRADLPPEFERAVLKCLQREAGDRYRDVYELAEALRPFASEGRAKAMPARPASAVVTMPESRNVVVVAPRAAVSAVGETAVAVAPAPRRHDGTLNAASSSRSLEAVPMKSRRTLWIAVAFGACAAVGAAGLAMRPVAAPDHAGAAATVAPPEAATAAAKTTAVETATAPAAALAPLPALTAPAASSVPALAPVATASPEAARPRPARPTSSATRAAAPTHAAAAATVEPAAPAPAPAPSPAGGIGDLILDRK